MKISRECLPILSLAFVVMFSTSCLGQAPTGQDTNLYVLNLIGKGTLKDFFDAGLRPKRWESSLVSECLVEDKLLRFVITNNYAVTLYAHVCTLKVNANGSLRSIWAESPYLTIDQARRWMLPVVETFGKSPRELDDYLKLVGTADRDAQIQMRLKEGSSSYGVGTPAPLPQSDLPFMGVELRWRRNRELPTQMIVRIEWERPFAEMRSPDIPPSAPPGYEQFPIRTEAHLAEAQRTVGPLPVWLETSSSAQAASSPTQAKSDGPSASVTQSPSGDETGSVGRPQSFSKLWLLLVGGAACGLVFWLFARRKRS